MNQRIERLAFDSNAIIYFVEQFPRYFEFLSPIFARVARGECRAVVSVVAQAEALVKPFRNNDRYAEHGFASFFSAPGVDIVELDSALALRAARFRAKTGISLPDAIIVQTAVQWNCDAIVGNDRAWAGLAMGIPYINLDEATRTLS